MLTFFRISTDFHYVYILGNKFGNRLVYVAIAVNTSLNPITLGYQEGLPIHNNWEEFVRNEVIKFLLQFPCNQNFVFKRHEKPKLSFLNNIKKNLKTV